MWGRPGGSSADSRRGLRGNPAEMPNEPRTWHAADRGDDEGRKGGSFRAGLLSVCRSDERREERGRPLARQHTLDM